MSRAIDDTDGVRIFIHALAEVGGVATAVDLMARTGLAEGSLQYIASRARQRLASLPDVSIKSASRRCPLTFTLTGLSHAGAVALLGPSPGPLKYLGFTRSRALIARILVEAGGEPVASRGLALAAFPGASNRVGCLHALREAIFEMRKMRTDAGETTGPVPSEDGDSLAYAWGTLAEAATPPTARETPSVRVTLPSVAGHYVFAAGQLYRDGQRCDPTRTATQGASP